MLILKPNVHCTIWGGETLKHIYPCDGAIGHLYSCVPGGEFDSEIIYPESKVGQTLGGFLRENPIYRNAFPYVIAIVTPGSDLSIQVHPPRGLPHQKNESWVFLNAPKMGTIYGGCLAVDTQTIKNAIENGTLMEYVEQVAVADWDYVYVEGGTLHAMTAGCVVYEIEESGGATCRLFDYRRRQPDGSFRPLQIDEGIRCLRVENRVAIQPFRGGDTIVEKKYALSYHACCGVYSNVHSVPVCITVLGDLMIHDTPMSYGMSLILFPGEQVDLANNDCFVARAVMTDI